MDKELIHRYFRKPPALQTERLKLRKLTITDAADMYAYASREEVTKYLTWYPHPSFTYTMRYLAYLNGQYRAGQFWDWGVEYKENGKMIGTCGFTSFSFGNSSAEIGFVLNPDYRGRGLTPEAVRAVMRVGFEELGCHRIEAKFIRGNDASRRVMEKCGMQFEGFLRDAMTIKDRPTTIGICSILEEEWERLSHFPDDSSLPS